MKAHDFEPIEINQIIIEEEEKEDKFANLKNNKIGQKLSHRGRKKNMSMHKQDKSFPGRFYYWTENDDEKDEV